MNTTILPISICKCGKILDSASGTGEPKPGDFSVCVDCYELLKFDENLLLKTATQEELDTLPHEFRMELMRAVAHIHTIKKDFDLKDRAAAANLS